MYGRCSLNMFLLNTCVKYSRLLNSSFGQWKRLVKCFWGMRYASQKARWSWFFLNTLFPSAGLWITVDWGSWVRTERKRVPIGKYSSTERKTPMLECCWQHWIQVKCCQWMNQDFCLDEEKKRLPTRAACKDLIQDLCDEGAKITPAITSVES